MELEKSKADKMFEKLGYKNHWTHHPYYMFYEKDLKENAEYENDSVHIEFNFEKKTINKTYGDDNTACDIDMQELQAINEKCIELGWV